MRCYYNQIQQGKTPDGNLTQDQIERLEEIGFKCTSSSDHTCKKCLRVLVAVAEQQEKDEQEGTRQRTRSNLKLLQQENESVVVVPSSSSRVLGIYCEEYTEKKDLIWIDQEEVSYDGDGEQSVLLLTDSTLKTYSFFAMHCPCSNATP